MRSVTQKLSASRTVFSFSLIILIATFSCLFSLSAYAAPPVENVQCILGQPGAPNGLQCTSNDISLSTPIVDVFKGCDFPGDTAILEVIVDITNNAQSRYDIAVWMSVDGDPNGDGSKTGMCSVVTMPNNILDQAGNSVNLDGDACGDVANNGFSPNVLDVNMGQVDLLCNDTDGDGFLNVPIIIAWTNSNNNQCTDSTKALPGTGAKCRINNELNLPVPVPAQLIVNKNTVPDNSIDFPFNLSGPAAPNAGSGGFDGDHDFTLADNETFDTGSGVFIGGLPAGSYVLVENPTAGWQNSYTCSSNLDGGNTNAANLTLRPGEIVTCDYVNIPTTGTLTVRKQTTAGLTGSFDFTVAGGTVVAPFTLDTGISNPINSTQYVLEAGNYSVTESFVGDWALTSATCSSGGGSTGTADLANLTINSIAITPGSNVTCIFVNAPLGSVGIAKTAIGGDATFGFVTSVPGGPGGGDFDLVTANGSASAAITGVPAGTYQVAEDNIPAGWVFSSATCVNDSQQDVTTATVVPNGVEFTQGVTQTTTCTFVNIKLGTIAITKVTDPGGNLTDSFGFDNDAALLPATFNLMDGGTQTILNVPVSSNPAQTTGYAIVEQDPTPGFDLTAVACTSSRGELDNPSSGSVPNRAANIAIRAGETVSCTFTNTQRASITVAKQITANPNGLSTAFAFSQTFDASGGFVLNPALNVPDSLEFADIVPGQSYTVTEANPNAAGWALISATCGTQGETVDLGAGAIAGVVPQAGAELTCTFINAPLGSASIVKNAVGGNGVFGFSGSLEPFNNGGAGFDIDTSVSNSADFTNMLLPAVDYDVLESTVPANWTLTSVVCSDLSGGSFPDGTENPAADPALGASINAEVNETVTCTFTNEADAQLTINKVTVPASDVSTQFAFTGTGAINASNLVGGGSVSAMGPQGTFVADETPTAGWALTNIACAGVAANKVSIGGTGSFTAGDTDVSLALDPGDDAACTYTNTKLGSITITKTTVGDVGDFTFIGTDSNDQGIITSPFVLSTDPNSQNVDSVTYNGLLPGDYAFDETVPAGWTINGTGGDIVCTGQTGSTVTPGSQNVSIALLNGEDISCTFTNTKLASLSLVKTVTNDHGGAAVDTDWTLSAAGPTPLSGAGGVVATFVGLGAYTLSESAGPAGYTASDWSCTDGSLNGAVVTLAAGDVAVCTIVNDDDAASLALVKNVTNDNGGTADATDWTLSAAGPTPISGAGGVAATPVSAGVYTLSESAGPTGYTASAWSCSGGTLNGASLSLALGETASCQITNDDDAASLALVKIVTNNNGGSAVATDWTLSAAGPTPISGAGGVAATPVSAGVYTLSESAGPAGYTASAWSCSGGTLNGASLTLALGETAACEITNDDNAPGLTLIKTVINDNGGTADKTEWILSAAGPTPISGAGGVPATEVDAGTYTLSESAGPAGYTAGNWACDGGTLQGNSLELTQGESAVCTIINDDNTANLSLVKTVNNDNQGSAVATEWTLSAAGPTPLSGAGGVAATDVDAGVYTLSEAGGPDGYTAGDWSCTAGALQGDSLTLGNGQTAVCTIINDDDPAEINLAKTVNGPATNNGNGIYTVVYTIVASNSGGPGVYDLVDAFSPGTGITLNTATAVYVAGTESIQNGTLGGYPNFVTGEGLAPGLNESWTVTAIFTVDPAQVDPVTSQCDPAAPAINTGFYNAVSGSSSDTDPSDNDTCTGLNVASLTLVKVLTGNGNAVPSDFALTLTGADGTHDSGVNYYNGAMPAVEVGVAYQVSETPNQEPDYILDGISCVDNSNQAIVSRPFTLTSGQAVTCIVTNVGEGIVPDTIAVPVDSKLALLLLTLLMLGTGLYMKSGVTRKPE